ncbi:MAG: glycosyltransferase family 39 protein [Chloroflexi bacterium]|nr:glycosyltransferase family 39 protein [Chloroflexota bacterium]
MTDSSVQATRREAFWPAAGAAADPAGRQLRRPASLWAMGHASYVMRSPSPRSQLRRPADLWASRSAPLIALVAILVIAAFLQLRGLGDKSLWDDEVFTVRIAGQRDLAALLAARQESERQPPLHYVLLHAWMRLAGSSDAAVRLPSAFLSAASVGLVGWLGWRLAGWQVGLPAAYLLAISPFLLLYGRMARYYALALSLSLLSTALLVEALHRSAAGLRAGMLWAAYAAATVAMLLSSYPTAAVAVAQQVFVLLLLWRGPGAEAPTTNRPGAEAPTTNRGGPGLVVGTSAPGSPASVGASWGFRRSAGRWWLASQGVIAAGFVVWLTAGREPITSFSWAVSPYAAQGWRALVLKLVYPLYAFSLGETIFPWHPLALVALGLLTVLVPYGLVRWSRLGIWGWLPAVGFAVTFLSTVLAFQLFVRDLPFITLASRAIGALPFLVLIIAAGLAGLSFRLRLLALLGLTVAAGAAGWNYFAGQQYHNPVYAVPTREIVQMILAEARPTDLIVADRDVNVDYYYQPPAGGPALVLTRAEDAVRAAVASGQHRRVWLVTFGRDRTRGETPVDLEGWLAEQYPRSRWWGFVPQDATYSRIKERIQGYPDYRFKATARLFEQ